MFDRLSRFASRFAARPTPWQCIALDAIRALDRLADRPRAPSSLTSRRLQAAAVRAAASLLHEVAFILDEGLQEPPPASSAKAN